MVVPTRDRPELACMCMAALKRTPGLGEVIIVDDGSQSDAARALAMAAEEHGFKLLRNPRSLGPAAARNRGWREASSAFIAFTDDDCLVDLGWMDALWRALLSSPEDVAGVGGRVLPATSGLISSYMTLHRILEPPASLTYLVTANSCFRRSALEESGGFDEAVRTPGGEDPGLCFALRRLGYRFGWAPDAVVSHHYRENLADFLKTFYRYGRGCRHVLDP